jgi:hypothetical protein
MDYSKEQRQDLKRLVAKRQVELIDLGVNIEVGKSIPHEQEGAFYRRLLSLIGAAEELTKRREHVKFDLTKQHPFIKRRILAAIKRSSLLNAPPPKKQLLKPRPRRRQR